MKRLFLLVLITTSLSATNALADSCAVAGMYTQAYYQCKQYELQRQQAIVGQGQQGVDPCESPFLKPLERGQCSGRRGAAQMGRGLSDLMNNR